MREEKPPAIVEIVDYTPTKTYPMLRLDCQTWPGFRSSMEIPLAVAEELYVELGARLWEAKSNQRQ